MTRLRAVEVVSCDPVLTHFAGRVSLGFRMGYERKGRVQEDSNIFDLSTWKNEAAFT